MKKSIIILIVFLFTCQLQYAQNMNDALRYSMVNNEGTARSVAMGNAFTALGGDIGALNINPAASGVFRYTEFTYTPSIITANSDVNYLGTNLSDHKTKFGTSNFGFVTSFSTGRKHTGLINWNIGVAYNKDNNYTNIVSAIGRTAQSSWLSSLAARTDGIDATRMDINSNNDPYYNFAPSDWRSILAWNASLLDTLPGTYNVYKAATENLDKNNIVIGGELEQRYNLITIGNTATSTLNFGGNISNKLFIGANVNIKSIWYKMTETYSESAINSNDFTSGFNNFNHRYSLKTTGTGVSLGAGVIYLPVKWLRLGASIVTPTWMYLYEEWEEGMSSSFNDGYRQKLDSPLGSYNYQVTTPFRWSVGIASTLGKIGAISFDYENVNYSAISMKDKDDNFAFTDANNDINNSLGVSNILRAGIEVNPTGFFAVRAGYQYISSPYKYNGSDTQIGSLGVGFSSKGGFFTDIAYQQLMKKYNDKFTLYDTVGTQTAPEGINKNGWWKLLVTVGFRF